jgi:hypothetical protein
MSAARSVAQRTSKLHCTCYHWDRRVLYIRMCLSVCLSIYLSICLSIYNPLLDHGRFFSFLILYTVDRTPWTGDQPVARPLPTCRTTQTQNKRTQTSMPCVGFEPTLPAFELATTVRAFDREATVIGIKWFNIRKIRNGYFQDVCES